VPFEVIKWEHPYQKETFVNILIPDSLKYILGISPHLPGDPDLYSFNVKMEFEIEDVFFAVTSQSFEIKIVEKENPSPEFLFALLFQASRTFLYEFRKRTAKTNMVAVKINDPDPQHFYSHLSKMVDFWNKHLRYLPPN
jgi:hypothetical protein